MTNFIFQYNFDNILNGRKIEHFIHEIYAVARGNDLFSMIRDYPDSEAAIKEFKECITNMQTEKRFKIVQDLLKTIKLRLLHPGAHTELIITFYLLTAQALYQLDPSGSYVSIICEPIRNYIKNRTDSAEVIVQHLSQVGGDEEPQYQSDEDWYPPPRESMLSNSKISLKMNKIDQLVDLFALPDQVAPTFQRILFDRLISNFKSAGHENLVPMELKLTLTKVQHLLGEDHLVNSQVMIKDCEESSRLGLSTDMVKVLVYSKQLWPEFVHPIDVKDTNLVIPNDVQNQIDKIKESFSSQKVHRHLEFRKQMASVTIEIEIGDRVDTIACSPVQAAIINYCSEREISTVEEISKSLSVPPESVNKRISFWVSKGYLKDLGNGNFKSIEPNEEILEIGKDENEETPEQLELERKKVEQEQNFEAVWNYIRGMLQNLGQIKLARLETMLKTFSSFNPQLKIDSASLIELLSIKEKEGLIISEDGNYKLRRQ